MGILEAKAVVEAAERVWAVWARVASQTPPELNDELSRLAQTLAAARRGPAKPQWDAAQRVDPRQGGPL